MQKLFLKSSVGSFKASSNKPQLFWDIIYLYGLLPLTAEAKTGNLSPENPVSGDFPDLKFRNSLSGRAKAPASSE